LFIQDLHQPKQLVNFLLSFYLFTSNSGFRLALCQLLGVGKLGHGKPTGKATQSSRGHDAPPWKNSKYVFSSGAFD
jgi:hypothetical protein